MKRFRSDIAFQVFGDLIMGGLVVALLVIVNDSVTIKDIFILVLILMVLSYFHLVSSCNDVIVNLTKIEIHNVFKVWSPEKYFDFNEIRGITIRKDKIVPLIELYMKNNDFHRFPCLGITGVDLRELHTILKEKGIRTEMVN